VVSRATPHVLVAEEGVTEEGSSAEWFLFTVLHARRAWRALVAEAPGVLAALARWAPRRRRSAYMLRLLADALTAETAPTSAGRRPSHTVLQAHEEALEGGDESPNCTVQELLTRIAAASRRPAAAAEARAALLSLGLGPAGGPAPAAGDAAPGSQPATGALPEPQPALQPAAKQEQQQQQQQSREAAAASSAPAAARTRRACTACGRTRRDGAELRRCAGCGHVTGVRYCSPECCRQDWLQGHRTVCEAARGLGSGD
jgi:hypothetical protein